MLLAIADTVSDVNSNRLWMGQSQLAAKARVTPKRVSDALEQLVADGWLVKVEQATHTQPAVYELLVGDRETVWEPRRAAPSGGDARGGGDAASPPDAEGGGDGPSPGDAEGGPDATATGEGTQRPGGGDAASPEPKRTQQLQPNGGSASPRHVAAASGSDDDTYLLTLEDAKGALTQIVDLRNDRESFEALWMRYPRHPDSGRMGGGGDKQLGLQRWSKLPYSQRRLALERLRWYRADLAATGTPPLHAQNYISRRYWLNLDGMPAEGADGLDDLELAVADVCGIQVDAITGKARGDLVTASAALRAAGATGKTLAEVARRWRRTYPDIPVTPAVLVKHWHRYAPQVTAGGSKSSGLVCPHCKQRKDAEMHTDAQCVRVAELIGAA